MKAENERLRRPVVGKPDLPISLGVTRRSRDELTHSAILGWLLDSTSRHGLGNRLVVALLSHLGLDVGVDHHFVVRREIGGGTARADLALWSGERKVVIENKLDAIEQPWQCQRLADDHPEAQALIFLTPTGRAPATAGAEDSWHSVRWSVIANLLEAALGDSDEDSGTTHRRGLPVDASEGVTVIDRIEDEPVRFFLRHRAQIEAWATLDSEPKQLAHQAMSTLGDRLAENPPADAEVLVGDDGGYDARLLYRLDWRGDDGRPMAAVGIGWHPNRVDFKRGGPG